MEVCNIGFLRAATYRDGSTETGLNDRHEIPEEHVDLKYKTLKVSVTYEGNFTTEGRYLEEDEEGEYVTIYYTQRNDSHTGTMTTWQEVSDDECSHILRREGIVTYESIQQRHHTSLDSGGNPIETSVVSGGSIVVTWDFDGEQTIPNPDYDENEPVSATNPETVTTQEGEGVRTRTDNLISYSYNPDTYVTETTTKTIVTQEIVTGIDIGLPIGSSRNQDFSNHEEVYTNTDEPPTHKIEKIWDFSTFPTGAIGLNPAGAATRTTLTEFLEPWAGRVRFIIPHDFDPPPEPHPQKWHGSWQNIEYHRVFTPIDHDEGDPEISPIVRELFSTQWTGPGDELDTFEGWDALSDEEKEERRASWRTAWEDVGLPEEPGHVTVELHRSQCYHGAPWVLH